MLQCTNHCWLNYFKYLLIRLYFALGNEAETDPRKIVNEKIGIKHNALLYILNLPPISFLWPERCKIDMVHQESVLSYCAHFRRKTLQCQDVSTHRFLAVGFATIPCYELGILCN